MFNKTEQDIMKNWQGDISKPVVSICSITYNHEKYITEAIDSFLMQETEFPFEIVIGEDCSTDDTRKVIEEYISKYPNLIKLIISDNNVGANANFERTLKFCQGKYIALCEGDDYWIDAKKLQTQIKFLENNIEYAGSGHQAKIVGSSNIDQNRVYRQNIKNVLNKNDFLRDCPFQTASFIFKANIIKKHPLPQNILSGDKAIMLLVSRFGLIKYFNESMSAYRLHEGGLSGNVTMDMMLKDLNIIPWIIDIDLKFPKYRYKSYLHECIMLFPRDLKVIFFLKHFFLYLIYSFSFFPSNLTLIYKMIVRLSKALFKKIKLYL